MSTKALSTADDLERIPQGQSQLVELDEGELVAIPPPEPERARLIAKIHSLLASFADEHRLGHVYPVNTAFRLSPNIVRVPDVGFARQNREMHGRFLSGSPDLAVQLYLAGDDVRQGMRRVKQLLALGCHTLWFISPAHREFAVMKSDGTDIVVPEGQPPESPEWLPGFSVPVEEFFGNWPGIVRGSA